MGLGKRDERWSFHKRRSLSVLVLYHAGHMKGELAIMESYDLSRSVSVYTVHCTSVLLAHSASKLASCSAMHFSLHASRGVPSTPYHGISWAQFPGRGTYTAPLRSSTTSMLNPRTIKRRKPHPHIALTFPRLVADTCFVPDICFEVVLEGPVACLCSLHSPVPQHIRRDPYRPS